MKKILALFMLIFTISVFGQSLTYLSDSFNQNTCETIIAYEACSGEGNANSHFSITFPGLDCIDTITYTSSGGYEYEFELGYDPTTDITGIKANYNDEFDGCDTITFTVQGQYIFGIVEAAIKYGDDVDYVDVWGAEYIETCECSTLPVEIDNFDVYVNEQNTHTVRWDVLMEIEVSHYEVYQAKEHKGSIGKFKLKAQVEAKGEGLYEVDINPHCGYNYYRLKTAFTDGSEEWYVQYGDEPHTLSLWHECGKFTIYNLNGQPVNEMTIGSMYIGVDEEGRGHKFIYQGYE